MADKKQRERCCICGCLTHRGGDYAKPTFVGEYMKTKAIFFALGLSALGTPPITARALTYVVYTNVAEFAGAVGSLSEYDFENIPVGTNCKNYDFGDFVISGAALYAVTIKDDNTHELYLNSSSYAQNMSLSFHNPIVAFGFDWRNTDNNSDMLRVDFKGTRYVLGAKDEVGFWGVIATEGLITSDIAFQFGDTPGGSGWTAGNLDNFRYAEYNVTIGRMQLSGNDIILEWSANASGLTYAVESCSNLSTDSWSLTQPTSQWWTVNTVWTNTQEIASNQFFRVRTSLDNPPQPRTERGMNKEPKGEQCNASITDSVLNSSCSCRADRHRFRDCRRVSQRSNGDSTGNSEIANNAYPK